MVELKPFPGVTERMGSPLGRCPHEPSTRKEGSEIAQGEDTVGAARPLWPRTGRPSARCHEAHRSVCQTK